MGALLFVFEKLATLITMIGGLVKKNCTDPLDSGTYCWSEDVKASCLGAFFYTYTFQIGATWAGNKLGYNLVLRIYMIISGLLNAGLPLFASISPYLIVISQAIRGLLAGIVITNNFEVVRWWTTESDRSVFFSLCGSALVLGAAFGQMFAGLISANLGWQYYFYFSGSIFFILFALHCIFVSPKPHQSRFISEEEKKLFVTKPEDKLQVRAPLIQVLQRVYVWAFSVYILIYNICFYNMLNVIPFYLNETMNLSTTTISLVILGVAVVMSVSSIMFARLYPKLDQVLPWLRCRQLFTFIPMIGFFVSLMILPNINSPEIVIFILIIQGVFLATPYSGSVMTINYEMDPINSTTCYSIFNSIAQLAGFLGPWMKAKITTTDKLLVNYDEVYKQKWTYFFYITSIFPLLAVFCVWLSSVVKSSEWDRTKHGTSGRESLMLN